MRENKWTGAGGSVIGPLHRKKGQPNQDAWTVRSFRWGHVAVVSDGLGSKAFSHVGSRAVCLAVVTSAKVFQQNSKADINDLLRLIHANWLVNISPYETTDCLATCLFAILVSDKLILGRLGDGMIVTLRNQKNKSQIMTDQKQMSFSNMTECMSDCFHPELWDTAMTNSSEVGGVLLCTDGLSDDILPDQRISFTSNLISTYRTMTRRRRSEDICKWMVRWPVPGHSDDKTLACLINDGVG